MLDLACWTARLVARAACMLCPSGFPSGSVGGLCLALGSAFSLPCPWRVGVLRLAPAPVEPSWLRSFHALRACMLGL